MILSPSEVNLSGKYRIAVPSRGIDTGFFGNMLLNGAVDRMMVSSWKRCKLGSGNKPPALFDTDLQEPMTGFGARTEVNPVFIPAIEPDFVAIGAFDMEAIPTKSGYAREVGMYDALGNLISRSLIRDALGDLTEIWLEQGEPVIVTYRIEQKIPTGAITTTLTDDFKKTEYQVTSSAALIQAHKWCLDGGAIGLDSPLIQFWEGYLGDPTDYPDGGPTISPTQGRRGPQPSGTLSAGAYWSTGKTGTFRTLYIEEKFGAHKHEFDPPISKESDEFMAVVARLRYTTT